MHHYKPSACSCFLILIFFILLISCHEEKKVKTTQLVADPMSIDEAVQKNIQEQLSFAADHNGKIGDSLQIQFLPVLQNYYETHEYIPVWSSSEKWKPFTRSLINYLDTAAYDGLFRDDYHFPDITDLKQLLDKDSVKRTDAVLWTKADLMLTDAFMHVMQDLKQGRLQADSVQWKNIPEKSKSFFAEKLERLEKNEPLDSILVSVQPVMQGYYSLKSAIRNFIDSMDTSKYTYIPYPYKQGAAGDSIEFVNKLHTRLKEASIISVDKPLDSLQLSAAIKKYQQQKKINPDGKITASLIRRLNMTDLEKYNRIAITLDRYKAMPEKMPEKYILVNLPGFYLQVWDADTVAFTSKIICGKPSTSTPLISSAITDMVIYPTWTVPTSIIKKEILPGLKKNAGYLAKKGLNLINNKGERIDPSTVNWANYSKGIPYKVQQGSGDDNALGVIKFNFNNPFDVYLHDTLSSTVGSEAWNSRDLKSRPH